jgi:NitT/TauT family transport system permease protein
MKARLVLRPGTRGYGAAVTVARLALVALALGVWQAGHELLGNAYVAGPLDVARRIAEITADGQLWPHLGATLLAAGLGFVIGWALGFASAVLLNFSPRASSAFEPYVMVAMGIPLFALIPLLILWFGIGITPKVVIVVSLVFFIVFITTFSGLRSIDRKLLDMARVMGASRRQITDTISRHAILPHVFAGLKIAVPRAISAAIVGEFLVADRGLGYYIEQARQTVDPVGVFAGIVLVTILVLLSDILLGWLQRRAFQWQHSTHTF